MRGLRALPLLMLLSASVAAAQGADCPGGEFLVRGRALIEPLRGGTEAVVLGAGGTVAIASGCEPARATVVPTRRGLRIDARWDRCGPRERVRLRATVSGRACDRLAGILRARGTPPRRVRARRGRCTPGAPRMRCARFLAIAHRGGADLRPENTLPAFAHAVALGADVLEMDVHATADGVVVLLHDDTLDRTTDGRGPVSARAFADLRTLDAGFRFTADGGATFPHRGQGIRIPSLEEVLAALPGLPVSIEIKQYAPSIVDPVLEVLRRTGATSRAVLVSFDAATIAEVRTKAPPELLTGMSLGETFAFAALDAAEEAGYAPPSPVVQIPDFLVTPAAVARANRFGVVMQVWTVDDRAGMDTLLGLGVHGVMSNDPAVLRAAVDQAIGRPQAAPAR